MTFTLTMEFEDHFEFKGKIFDVDMAFDNIILLFEMFDNTEIMQHEKVFMALRMLIYEYDNLELDSYEETYQLFEYVMKEFLDIDLSEEKEEDQTKIYDFNKDAELIFASFFAVYGMDLFDLQGKLHWRKFNALLANLDDNSPFKQVISYRTMKVPTEKEATKEYIDHIRKMKSLYSLNDEDPDHINQTAFDQLSRIFKSQ